MDSIEEQKTEIKKWYLRSGEMVRKWWIDTDLRGMYFEILSECPQCGKTCSRIDSFGLLADVSYLSSCAKCDNCSKISDIRLRIFREKQVMYMRKQPNKKEMEEATKAGELYIPEQVFDAYYEYLDEYPMDDISIQQFILERYTKEEYAQMLFKQEPSGIYETITTERPNTEHATIKG